MTLNIKSILTAWAAEPWAMEPAALDGWFRQLAAAPLNQEPLSASLATAAPSVTYAEGVAIVPISGTLLKSVPKWMRAVGFEVTGQDEIQNMIADALGSDSVDRIVLHISSPGGQVAGGAETGELIAAANKIKPVTAYIEDLGASGAYWLASQAGRVNANATASVGSIGVYMVTVDYSEWAKQNGIAVNVVRSGEHKGAGVMGAPITAEHLAAMQEIVDGLADAFVAAVARGRNMKKAAAKQLATGRVWLAKTAADCGLIDAVEPLQQSIRGDGRQYNATDNVTDNGDQTMADNDKNTPPVDTEAIRAEAHKSGQTAERERFTALQAAFPEEADFVATQFAAGADVQSAKAAFADVLAERLQASEANGAELKEQLAKAQKSGAKGAKATAATTQQSGAEPVPFGEGGAEQDADFMSVAKALAAEKGISMTAAMRQVSREQPELHAAFRRRK